MKYKTKQRDIILDILMNNKDRHLSAEELQEEIALKKSDISRATLYRTLDTLTEDGKIKKIFVDDKNPAYYQICDSNISNHFHLVCEKCGKLIHLECHDIDDMIIHIKKEHNFKVNPLRVVLYGECEECLKNEI